MVRLMAAAARCCCCSCCPLLWLLFCCCIGTGAGGRWRGRRPEFGEAEDAVKVKEGETARLPCVVFHLNDRAVTWLRRRDLHILTTGHHTYSADDRFQVVHSPGSDQWTLVVTYAQLRDSGIYECQVNTDPKLSRPVMLNVYNSSQPISVSKSKVFVANNTASTRDGHLRVEILGPRELYIEEGSSLTLKCLVTSSFGPATLVYWYHDTRLIDYASPRGGIKLKIDHELGETTARLVVETVTTDDSGMYSCVPSGSHPASVRVHVHQAGEQKAAIQQGGLNDTSSCTRLAPLTFLPCLLPLLLLLYLPHLLLSLPVLPSSLSLLASVMVSVGVTQSSFPHPHTVFVYLTCLMLSQSASSLLHFLRHRVLHYLTKYSTILLLQVLFPSFVCFSNVHLLLGFLPIFQLPVGCLVTFNVPSHSILLPFSGSSPVSLFHCLVIPRYHYPVLPYGTSRYSHISSAFLFSSLFHLVRFAIIASSLLLCRPLRPSRKWDDGQDSRNKRVKAPPPAKTRHRIPSSV